MLAWYERAVDGTYVNGEYLVGARPLCNGDLIRLGGAPYLHTLIATVPTERMLDRRRLLDGLNPTSSDIAKHRSTTDWQDLHGRAFDLTSGSEGREPFELQRESTATRERYGMHPLGQNLLLARRLIESGVGFVTVNGWTGPSPNGGGGPPASGAP